MLRSRAVALTVILWIGTASVARAADPGERRAVLRINTLKGTYVLESQDRSNRRVEGRLDDQAPQSFILRPGEKIAIVVIDPDPFFYDYHWTSAQGTKSENATVAGTFGKSILSFIGGLEPTKKGGGGTAGFVRKPGPLLASTARGGQVMLAAFRVAADSPEQLQGTSVQALEGAADLIRSAPMIENNQALESSELRVQQIMEQAIEVVRGNPVPSPRERIRKILGDAGISDPQGFLQEFKVSLGKIYLFTTQTEDLKKQVDRGQGDATKERVRSWDLDSLQSDIEERYRLLRKAGEKIQEAVTPEASEELRNLNARIASQEAEEKTKGLSQHDFKELQKDKDRRKKLLEEEEERIAELAELRAKIKTLEGRPCPCKELEKAKVRVAELEESNMAEEANRNLKQEILLDPFYFSLNFILTGESNTRDTLKQLQGFAVTMKRVNEPLELVVISHDDVTVVDHGKLKISVSKDLPDGVTANRTPVEYSFDFRPFSAARLGVGAAVVYSFVKKHKFDVTPEDGKFRIVDTQGSDYSGTNIAAMLTITPSAWADSDFHAFFEVGVKPETDLGIFGGFSFQLSNIFSVGGGVAFEQVEQLKEGLSRTVLLNSKDELKTTKRFQAGFYLHITASTNFGK